MPRELVKHGSEAIYPALHDSMMLTYHHCHQPRFVMKKLPHASGALFRRIFLDHFHHIINDGKLVFV